MRDLLTTRNQNCWKELIEKEQFTRLSWKQKYTTEHPLNPPQTIRKRRELFIPRAETILPPLVNVPKKAEQKMPDEESHAHPGKETLVEMRPATPHASHALYDGFSKEGKGRYMYLRMRKQLGPEEKYPHPILSSWDYGWRLGEVVKEFKFPIHGRSKIVRDTFYSRNGIYCQPSHTDKML
ncbi:protein ATP6V1FNB [Bombina bombina]|uniref:protein ATP6V1FNB n=1 Tax=Bombina bombina TaxID=8345 RepID=UPI00235B092B|nr:protein ATP6V1FNB [Bombina bombina]